MYNLSAVGAALAVHLPDLTALISQIDADRRFGTTPDHAVRSYPNSQFSHRQQQALDSSTGGHATEP